MDSLATRWTTRLALAMAACIVIGPLAAYLSILPPRIGFLVFGVGGLAAVLTTLLGVIGLVQGGGRAVLPGLIPGAGVAIWFVVSAVAARQYPRINDITTNLIRPVEFVRAPELDPNHGRNMRYAGGMTAADQKAYYTALKGVELPLAQDECFQRINAAAHAMPGWEITLDEPTGLRVEGVDTSTVFRFKDDFVIEVRPPADGAQGCVIEMRSKSRDGVGDMGVNAKRIEAFLAKIR